MKHRLILCTGLILIGIFATSCRSRKTYAEMKKDEKQAIERYIDKQDIKVIDKATFFAQDTMTHVEQNEYVLFPENGIYLQIERKGRGRKLSDGRYTLLSRYVEKRILQDGTADTLSLNNLPGNPSMQYPDEIALEVQGTTFNAAYTTGWMMSSYGSAVVPSGWLMPLTYLHVGREIGDRSLIRLIVPHSQGQSNAKSKVYPCYYEISYQLGR